jgi:hypothetical protein
MAHLLLLDGVENERRRTMNSRLSSLVLVAALVGTAGLAYGDDDLTSLSYISYLERYATVYPASNDETLDAQVNMPVLGGDRLDTARGARVEIQLADGCTVWLDEFSTVDFDSLAMSRDSQAQRTALGLAAGGLAIEIPSAAQVEENVRIDTARGSVFLSKPGLYRLSLDRKELHIETHAGLAELPVGVGSVMLRAGQQTTLEEDDDEDIQRASLDDDSDDFWAWVEERRHPRGDGNTAQYVDERNAGRAAVLDTYGEWIYLDDASTWAWRPRVGAGWQPYSMGRWYWTTVGWTWLSDEPWGWYPYHYGSWNYYNDYGWMWCWDWVWGPAWVHWMWADNYIGWCPRGYYDWWYGDNYHHGHDGHGSHEQGLPDRWSHTAYDFSGRVRLRDVDPRPWTFVPGDRFASSHIDRVRVDSNRVLGETGDRSDAFVRSGPLVTRSPGRDLADRGVGSVIRDGVGDRQTPDLGVVLRRDAEGLARVPVERSIGSPTRTSDLITRTLPSRTGVLPDGGGSPRVREPIGAAGSRTSSGGSAIPTTGRDVPRRTVTDRSAPAVTRIVPDTQDRDSSLGRTTDRGSTRTEPGADRSSGRSGTGSTPPTGRAEPGRSDPGRTSPVTPPGTGSAPGSHDTGRSVERAPAPPPPAVRDTSPAKTDPPPREKGRQQVSYRARALNAPAPRSERASAIAEERSRVWGSGRVISTNGAVGRTRQLSAESRSSSRQVVAGRSSAGSARASTLSGRSGTSRSTPSASSRSSGSPGPGRSYSPPSGGSRSTGSSGHSGSSSARSSPGSSSHSSSSGSSHSGGSSGSSRSTGSSGSSRSGGSSGSSSRHRG